MLDARLALTLLVAAQLAAPVFAQDKAKTLDDLDAERINPHQILIDFEFGGGACDTVGRPELGAITNGALAVTFPTASSAEVCTMQIKEHDLKYAVDAEEDITRVDVTLTAPDGSVLGTGSTNVDRD